MNIDINIDAYISEEEKKEIAVQVFKERIESVFNGEKGTAESNITRIISNLSYQIFFNKIEEIIPNYEQIIKDKIVNTIEKKDLEFQIFRRADQWGKASLGYEYIIESIRDNQDKIKENVEKAIKNHDYSQEVAIAIAKKVSDLSNSLYGLSELLLQQNEDKE